MLLAANGKKKLEIQGKNHILMHGHLMVHVHVIN